MLERKVTTTGADDGEGGTGTVEGKKEGRKEGRYETRASGPTGITVLRFERRERERESEK